MIQRRGFLAGVAAFLAAPAIIRTPGLLMPVKAPARLLTAAEIVDAAMWAKMQNPSNTSILMTAYRQINVSTDIWLVEHLGAQTL